MFADRDDPPYKLAGALLLAVTIVAGTLLFLQFRGHFSPATELTLLSPRAGLVVEPGAKVTYNGVEIGRVARIVGVMDDRAGPGCRSALPALHSRQRGGRDPRYPCSATSTCP